MQRPADRPADEGHLLELGQELGAGEDIFRSGMAVLAKRVHRNGSDVTLVDRPSRVSVQGNLRRIFQEILR